MAGSSSINANAMEQSCSHNQPIATITRPTEFVSLNQDDANNYAIDIFDFSYLDSPNSSSNVGVDPKIAFKDAFEVPSYTGNTEQINYVDDWDIPQINPEEATGPNIGTGLAKAVNAAVSVKPSKETMGEIVQR